jgi:heme/copper-type cytochrome/quinol oxidase subunit 2
MLAGAMSTVLVVAMFIGLLCLCIIRCRKHRQKSPLSAPFGANNDF